MDDVSHGSYLMKECICRELKEGSHGNCQPSLLIKIRWSQKSCSGDERNEEDSEKGKSRETAVEV